MRLNDRRPLRTFALTVLLSLTSCVVERELGLPQLEGSAAALLVIQQNDTTSAIAYDPRTPGAAIDVLPVELQREAQLTIVAYDRSLESLGLRPGLVELSPNSCEACYTLPEARVVLSAADNFESWSPAEMPELIIHQARCTIFDRLTVQQLQYEREPGFGPRLRGVLEGDNALIVDAKGDLRRAVGPSLELVATGAPAGGIAYDGERTYFMNTHGRFMAWVNNSWEELPSLGVEELNENIFLIELLHSGEALFALSPIGHEGSPDGFEHRGVLWTFEGDAWRELDTLTCEPNIFDCEEIKRGRMITRAGSGAIFAIYPPALQIWRYADGALSKLPIPDLNERNVNPEHPTAIRWIQGTGLIVGTSTGRLFVREGERWRDMGAPRDEQSPIRDIAAFADGFVFSDSSETGRMLYHSQLTGFCTPEAGVLGREAQQLISSGETLWALERGEGVRDEPVQNTIRYISLTAAP